MFSVAFRVFEFLLPLRGIEGHLPQDVRRQDMILQTIQGKLLLAFIESSGDRTHQPVLQDPDTANTALVEIDPIGADQRFHITAQWHLFQQRDQGRLELQTIRFPFEPIARKVDGQTAPADLPIELSKVEQIIRVSGQRRWYRSRMR